MTEAKKKYMVRHRVVIDFIRNVEADSEEEAIRKAKERSTIDYRFDKSEMHETANPGWYAEEMRKSDD